MEECVVRKDLLIAPWVAIGFAIAIAVLVQPSLARNDSNERECQQVDARTGLVTTICSSKTGNGWKVTVKTHNVSGLGKGFSTRCLPGSDEEIAANLEAFRLDIAPTVTVQRFITVDARERPKVDCKLVRIGDNFSDEPEIAFSRGLTDDKQGDASTAFLLWKPTAEQGDFDLQFRFGKMYLFGQGVKQDYVQAFKWFRLAADQGHSGAEGYLGALYMNGDGVQADKVAALRWYRLAAEHGDAYGQDILGELYEKAYLGLPQDYVQAVKWYRLAAEQGDASGQNSLGFRLRNGTRCAAGL